jgi:hypothetical protein
MITDTLTGISEHIPSPAFTLKRAINLNQRNNTYYKGPCSKGG